LFPGFQMRELASTTTVCAVRQQISCELDGEAVILDMNTGTYYGLNVVGQTVWGFVQERRTFQQILEKLLQEYDVTRSQCENDLRELLKDLHDAGLIIVD